MQTLAYFVAEWAKPGEEVNDSQIANVDNSSGVWLVMVDRSCGEQVFGV